MKINFLCRDSILAAPIVLDLALFLDLAQRAGFSGMQEWLSFYFKSPMTRAGPLPRARPLHPAHEAEEHAALDDGRGADHPPRQRVLRMTPRRRRARLVGFGFIADEGPCAGVRRRSDAAATSSPWRTSAPLGARPRARAATRRAHLRDRASAARDARREPRLRRHHARRPTAHAEIARAALERGPPRALREAARRRRAAEARALLDHARPREARPLPVPQLQARAGDQRGAAQSSTRASSASVHAGHAPDVPQHARRGVNEWGQTGAARSASPAAASPWTTGATLLPGLRLARRLPHVDHARRCRRSARSTPRTTSPARITFPNGTATAHLTWTAGMRQVIYTIHGERGAIRVEDDDIETVVKRPQRRRHGPRVGDVARERRVRLDGRGPRHLVPLDVRAVRPRDGRGASGWAPRRETRSAASSSSPRRTRPPRAGHASCLLEGPTTCMDLACIARLPRALRRARRAYAVRVVRAARRAARARRQGGARRAARARARWRPDTGRSSPSPRVRRARALRQRRDVRLARCSAIAAAASLALGHFGVGALLTASPRSCDALDGMVARLGRHRVRRGRGPRRRGRSLPEFFFLAGSPSTSAASARARARAARAARLVHGELLTAKAEALHVDPPRGSMRRVERAVYLDAGVVSSRSCRPPLRASHCRHGWDAGQSCSRSGWSAWSATSPRCAASPRSPARSPSATRARPRPHRGRGGQRRPRRIALTPCPGSTESARSRSARTRP